MDLRDAVMTAIRRWAIVGPMLLLTVLGMFAAYTTGPTRYLSSAVLVVTVPQTGNTTYGSARPPNRTNPVYLSDNNVTVTSAMLAQEMSGPDFAHRIGVGSAGLSVHNGAANPELRVTGPFLFINVDSDSPVEAQALVRRAVEEGRTQLQQWQADVGAPRTTFMTLVEIMAPSSPIASHGSRGRAAAAALALGLIACYAAAIAAERVVRSRERGARTRTGPAAPCSCSSPPDARTTRDEVTDDVPSLDRGRRSGSRV